MPDWSQISSDDFKEIKKNVVPFRESKSERSVAQTLCRFSSGEVPRNYTFLMTGIELATVKVCQVDLCVRQAPDNAHCLLLLLCTNSNLLSDLSSRIASILFSTP